MGDRFTFGSKRGIERARGRRMGTLWADFDTGEGEVTINEVVDDNLLLRADLLKHWRDLINAEYELTLEQLRQEFNRKRESSVIQFPGRKK